MATDTNRNYEEIERPYDAYLDRNGANTDLGDYANSSVSTNNPNTTTENLGGSSNGSVENQPVRSEGGMSDLWMKNLIRSTNWKPKKVGFLIDGTTGYAEFTNVYVSGNIQALTGSVGGFNLGSDYVRDTGDTFGLSSTVTGNNDVRLWAGASFANRDTAPFRVYEDGSIAGTGLTITKIDLPNITTTNSFHVDTEGNTWWGSTSIGTSVASILKTGAATFNSISITGGVIDGTTTVDGRLSSILAGAIDAAGHFADNAIDSANKNILGSFSFGASGALQIGTYVNGVSGDIKISPSGILGRSSTGATTFSINGTTGVAVLNGLVVGTNVGIGTAQDSSGVTTIIGNTVTTSYLNAKNITAGSVAAENITGTTITGKTISTSSSGIRVALAPSSAGLWANDAVLFLSGSTAWGSIEGTTYAQGGGITINGGDGSLSMLSGTSSSYFSLDNGWGSSVVLSDGIMYLDTTSSVEVTGHILPSASLTYNLGSGTYKWNGVNAGTVNTTYLYVNGNTQSGTNTGNETGTSIRSALGMTTLSGSSSGTNTGDSSGHSGLMPTSGGTFSGNIYASNLSGTNTGDSSGHSGLAALTGATFSGSITANGGVYVPSTTSITCRGYLYLNGTYDSYIYDSGSSVSVGKAGRMLTISSNKSAIVHTSKGFNALYCTESPEVWFMDFCDEKGKLDPMFKEVTSAPYKYIKCEDGEGYQVWGKRKGHEHLRFESKTYQEFLANEKFLNMNKPVNI